MRALLISLHIENIAVIKSADIDFESGFCVLTGETGAGKSMIIDSINLICGAKQSKELIRSGEESAEVSAVFGELPEYTVSVLSELGFNVCEDGLFMVSRSLNTGGRSTVRINGRTVPLTLARDAMKHLIGIHGQHDNMALLDPDNHILYLDEFAGLSGELADYAQLYDKYRELNRSISELTRNEREKAQRIEFLKYQIKEISELKLKPDEEEKLLARRRKLQNAEKILQLSEGIYSLIYRNEKGTSATDKINKASRALESLAPVMSDADSLILRLDSVLSELEDIALTVDALRDSDTDDPTAELDRVETRLDAISKIQRKYGDTIPEVLAFLERAQGELEDAVTSEDRLYELKAQLDELMPKLEKSAAMLTEKRCEAAKRLEERIVSELSYLDMGGVSFKVGFTHENEAGGAEYDKRGVDNVEFLISTNKGEPEKPLCKIASGGELSRIMLAIKSVLSEVGAPASLIFDEVDTGVSGKTAEKIGIKLRVLAASGGGQVLCVTHSAQIASRADNHYLIAKRESEGRVSTSVTPLDFEGRVNEVARIMGGINITDKVRETAREMITSQPVCN